MAEKMQFDASPEEIEVFCLEADELTGQLDADLLACEQGGGSADVIQRLFRAAHTLKGSAGAIGHQRMARLTHSMEAVLEQLRQGRMTVSGEMIDLLLQSVDGLRSLNQEVSTQTYSGFEPDLLVSRLKALVGGGASASVSPVGSAVAASEGTPPAKEGEHRAATLAGEGFLVVVQIAPDSIAPAARAYQVLMALDECGKIVECQPVREAIERGDPLLQVQVLVATSCDEAAIRQRLNHISELVSIAVGSQSEQDAVHVPTEPVSVKSAPATGGEAKASAGGAKTVRTSVERLDKLMNLVGELVTDRNRLLQTHATLRAHYGEAEFLGDLAQAISHLASITDELQEEVMRARMLPLEQVFSKFPRLIRDLSRDTGKLVTLEISGQETELDRSVVEEIGDPLMHLLRNAVDHGIELPEERRLAGKPETGTVKLMGRSEGNHIVITVADDGPGIDVNRVRRVAVERGFVSEDVAERLSEAEVMDLIFMPGLSTAKRVTDVSGRGVGMDVVRTNIERMHGSVGVRSVRGQGTTFQLSLPLTLAIMPVLLVGLCGDTYCIPLSSVTEVMQIETKDIHHVERGEVALWRGRLLPLLRLRRFFDFNGSDVENNSRHSVVAVRSGEEHIGVVVDYLLGQQEIVIKNLGHMIGQVSGIFGSTILGDGSVALIIDVPGLTKHSARGSGEQALRQVA